jgi:diaminopimelate epimerase
MQLTFTKMHGLGNDFVVVDAISQTVRLDPDQVRVIADRHFGVGCDQVLLVEPPRRPGTDFRYRIYNADGGEVQQCGNGARCFARFVRDHGLTSLDTITVETAGGIIRLYLEADGQVTVDMGVPDFRPAALPFVTDAEASQYPLAVPGGVAEIGAVSMGNPHAVVRVGDLETAEVGRLGPAIATHERFPEGVNAGFMQVLTPEHIRLRVHERGVGETLACGTGACAAVAVGRDGGLLAERVRVDLPGGTLQIRWSGRGEPVWMTGPAVSVFEGHLSS